MNSSQPDKTICIQRLGVLGKSAGIGEVGQVRWELLLCLLLTWVILYFCIWRGIGWTSKVSKQGNCC